MVIITFSDYTYKNKQKAGGIKGMVIESSLLNAYLTIDNL